MTTVGQSTFAITGELNVATARRATAIALTQSTTGLEAKGPLELTIAAGATVALPLTFSAGVAEALFLYLYSPKKMVVRVTGTDASHPGPMELGLKGIWMQTFTPGEGVAAVSITNPSTTEAVTIEYAYAALADAADAPEYWDDAVT